MSNHFQLILSRCAIGFIWCVPCIASADVYSEIETPGTKSAYHADPNVNSRRTDHFVMRFGPKPRCGLLAEQMYHGQMQFLEHCYDTWQSLGLRPLGGTDPTTKYKLVIQPRETWDTDFGGTACGFMEQSADGSIKVPGIHIPSNSLGYKTPNGCTPHECGHGWGNQGPGLPGPGAPGLGEAAANWIEQLHLAGYPQQSPVVGMPMGHAAVYYGDMSIFNYFMEAPGYGVKFINKLFFDPNVAGGDDVIRKSIRVDTSGALDKAGAIHDGLGMMNAKMLNMDFWNHRVGVQFPYDADTTRSGYHFSRIPMVRQPGVTGTWYRPEWTCTPQTLSNNYIPLTVTATGSNRTIACDFRPATDAVRGSSFRACFVAFNQNKELRYGRVWNAGMNSFTLADDEKTVYLAVIACPREWNIMFHCDYLTDNVAMFPYRISLTGANPLGWQWDAPSGDFRIQTLGGGKVANTATVDASVYVGPNAMVLGTAKVYGNSRIEDYALVDGNAVIGRSGQPDNPVISGHAYVTGTAQVYGHAKVRDYGWVWGASKVYDNAIVMAHSSVNGASVFGCAVLNQAPLRDSGFSYTNSYSGSAILGGDTSYGITLDKGAWCECFTGVSADNKYQYLGYNFEKKGSVFAMDQYGLNHSYLMGEPQVVGDTINSVATNVLNLDGTSQYVELRPDAVDFADLTISAWVKWSGSGKDVRIFSTGDGATKGMYLTPKDATTGKLRWVISDGTTTQSLNGSAALPSNTWTHVAVSLAAKSATLYVNGTAVATSAAITLAPDQLHAPLMADWNFIGRGNAGNYFAGRIDEFKVYNKALSAAEVKDLLTAVTTGTPPAADTAAPTPDTATWLVNPVVAGNNAITMSATEGADAGGNGVLYYFRCVEKPTHDSGWLSENKYTDCNCAAGATYSYTVKMKDKLGNAGTESTPMRATAAPKDVAAPTPNPPTFAAAPKGSGATSITMTATKGVDADETVMYQFSRVGSTTANSGWTSSRIWTDTGLTPGANQAYTLQMKDGRGNLTSVTTSPAALARDDSPPALDADFRMQWGTYPYTQLDKTIRLCAAGPAEMGVDCYYECVEKPSIHSAWIPIDKVGTNVTSIMWVTPAMADGTHSFHYKLRDRSPQLNESGWSTPQSAKVLTTNCYHDYALTGLSALPDSTMVRFSGKVTQVGLTSYTVCASDGRTGIKVQPRSYAYQTDATLLNQNVNVRGHLWTYTGSPKMVTGAVVAGNPQIGKIEFENGDYDDDLARPCYQIKASASEFLGWYQSGWSVSIPNVAATTQLTITHDGGGTLSLYVNDTHAKDVILPDTDGHGGWASTTVTGLSIPAGATLRFQQKTGAPAPQIDYLIVGPAYPISGKVADSTGKPVAGATVSFSAAANPSLNPAYGAITDASGNFTKIVPDGTWHVAASAPSLGFLTTAEQNVVVNGAPKPNINFAVQPVNQSMPRPNDLLFSLLGDMLPDAGDIHTWMSCSPAGMTFTSGSCASVEWIDGKKWMKSICDTSGGNFPASCVKSALYKAPVAINGATIVVAIKPKRDLQYNSGVIVSAFFNHLSLGVSNNTGRVSVQRNGVAADAEASTSIPDGQVTVLSLVIQPTGEYKVYANGAQVMNVTTPAEMKSLASRNWDVGNTLCVGNNSMDGWSTFNGNIGDVAFYKVALTDAERQSLETSIKNKFAGKKK